MRRSAQATQLTPWPHAALNMDGQSATLSLGTLTRTAPGTVELTLPASGSITTTTAVANGILGGYATLGGDWVTMTANGLAGLAVMDRSSRPEPR